MKATFIFFLVLSVVSCSAKEQNSKEINTYLQSFSSLAKFDSNGDYLGFKTKFIKAPAGSFMMGTGYIASQPDERPAHIVYVKNPFEVLTTEFTQKMWFELVGNNPSHYYEKEYCKDHSKISGVQLCPNLPVDSITREDVLKLARLLSKKSKKYRYDLPTEEQWEYFARAGTKSNFYWGADR